MIWWLVFAVWLVGWVLAVRPSMRRRMLQQVCRVCAHRRCSPEACRCICSRHDAVPRGAARERTGVDVAAAVWFAAGWPLWLVVVTVLVTLVAAGAAVKTAVIRATPLTGPELERRTAEQEAEIARLTELIGGGS